MFCKLLLVIASIGLTGTSLLVARQQRLDLAHDAERCHKRMQLQTEIARRCPPDAVREAANRLAADSGIEWVPIPLPSEPTIIPIPTDHLLLVERPTDQPPMGG
ncbi:MAG: hypothetical protein ACYTGR_18015 [Planctomycetota bacterium]|jgi:hypothetical protein